MGQSDSCQLSHHTGYFLACHLNGNFCDKVKDGSVCNHSEECILNKYFPPTTDTVAAIDDDDVAADADIDDTDADIDDTDADAATDADADADAATDADVATDAATDVDADA